MGVLIATLIPVNAESDTMLPSIMSPDISSEYCSELLTLERSGKFKISGGGTSCVS